MFDDKGNCAVYQYQKEDAAGAEAALGGLHNHNRVAHGDITYTNAYLSRVLYGNRTAFRGFGYPFPGAGMVLANLETDGSKQLVGLGAEPRGNWQPLGI